MFVKTRIAKNVAESRCASGDLNQQLWNASNCNAGFLAEAKFMQRGLNAAATPFIVLFPTMYDDFHVTDRWTGEDLHCEYQAVISAIATRHADAIDIKFLANGRNVWISLPHVAWAEYKLRAGKVITDPLAVQIAGHYLK